MILNIGFLVRKPSSNFELSKQEVLAYVRWWLTTGKGQNSNMEESTTDSQPTHEGFLEKLRMGSSFFEIYFKIEWIQSQF
jgi:hypothetical protein